MRRTTLFVVTFWTIAFAFVALDWSRATPHNRFDEPPPWQLGRTVSKAQATAQCH